MQASTIFLKVSHSIVKFYRSSLMTSLKRELMRTFLAASSLILCLNFTSKASFSNRIVSTVSSKQMFPFFATFTLALLLASSITIAPINQKQQYKLMGNYYCCQELTEGAPCVSQDKSALFRRKLRKTLKESKYRDACLKVAERHYDQTLELQAEEVLRQSIAPNSHYKANTLNQSISDDGQMSMRATCRTRIPSNFKIELENREHYLLRLIKESYLFLDFSDCVDNHENYDRIIRHEMMNDDPSLEGSFLLNSKAITKNLQSQLINFNPEHIRQLQRYVRFCRKVKHDFAPDRKRFLSKLSLNLQGQIIQKYQRKEFRKNTGLVMEMFRDIQEIISVLMATVQTMYDFQLDQEKDMEGGQQFFSSANVYTMITSIFFESEQFSSFITTKIKQCFSHKFKLYHAQYEYTKLHFIKDFIAINSKAKDHDKHQDLSNINTLFNSRCKDINKITFFSKSLKILQKIFKKSIPLFKLKLVYELNQEISRELHDIKELLSTNFKISFVNIFSRETELLVIKWLLRENSKNIDAIASHLIFTYQFVHRMHLIDRKGSCLTTFIQEVERIIQWTCPV